MERITVLAHRPGSGLVELNTVEETKAAQQERGVLLWIDFQGPSADATRIMQDVFGLHPLAIEDVFKDEHRPKIEDYERYLYMIFQAVAGEPAQANLAEVATLEVDLFLGHEFVITHHADPLRSVEQAREAIRAKPELMAKGAVYVAHAILDRLVDRWLPVAVKYEEEITRLEKGVLAQNGDNVLARILELTGGIQALRRMGLQQRDILAKLSRAEYDEVPADAKPFFRDVHEHFAEFMETLEFEREDLNAVFDAFHSLSSYRLNEVMKVLTVISTIVLPLTFMTGLYGMNFDNMPELHWWGGYYGLLLVMLMMVGVQVFYFRQRKWL